MSLPRSWLQILLLRMHTDFLPYVRPDSHMRTRTSKPEASHRPLNDMLWVDQYRPQRFTELLGNERVAREVMAWVKQWDWCVFGKRKSKKRPRDEDQNYDPEDEYHRPREKVR